MATFGSTTALITLWCGGGEGAFPLEKGQKDRLLDPVDRGWIRHTLSALGSLRGVFPRPSPWTHFLWRKTAGPVYSGSDGCSLTVPRFRVLEGKPEMDRLFATVPRALRGD